MKRIVKAKINKTDDTPWANARVLFKRSTGSFTYTTQYPGDTILAVADSEGNLQTQLWVNESGNLASNYLCYLPGDEPFEFSLPFGDGSVIELGILRQGSEQLENYPSSIINYVDEQIGNVQAGSTQIYSNSLIADTNLSALRIVNLKTKNYASSNNLSDTYAPLGLLVNSVTVGDNFKTLLFGEYSDSNWTWNNSPIFLGSDGLLTQVLNGDELFILEVAKALSLTNLMLSIKNPIILG